MNPIVRLAAWCDMTGKDGRLSFSKWVTLVVLVCATFWKLDAVIAIGVIAAAFGIKAFLAFVNRGTFNASSSVVRTQMETIIRERRDPDDGIEPTP